MSTTKPNQKYVLLGDEAIARGAIDAGMTAIYAYPGTPSTEILEYVHNSREAREGAVKACWAANEKTALEESLGVSYAGKRTMACMKHVGLNVAADPFINSAITEANGGFIVTVADDPSMHSSQNEQDSRVYGKFAMTPILEPSSQQEAYDMVHYGFDLSEKFKIPVMMRITTRLAHSRAGVARLEKRNQNELNIPENPIQFVLMPANARRQYQKLLNKQPLLEAASVESPFNKYTDGDDKSLGIIVSGIAYNYLMENYPDRNPKNPVLKIGQYPLPKTLIEKICNECDEVMVIEEGYPVIEEMLTGIMGLGMKVRGKYDGTLPRTGELNPNIVAKALGMEDTELNDVPELVKPRPPQLCGGCPHIDSYAALNEALAPYSKGRVMSDIGCYTLGSLPPYNAINSCVDMGASVTMAKGLADAGVVPAIAVIGDSTFTHSGITGLLDAVTDKSPITVIILDNETTAMTGGQPSSASGKLEEICRGVGVEPEHIRILTPLKKHHAENVQIIKDEVEYNGVSVIIPRRECVVTLNQKTKSKKNN